MSRTMLAGQLSDIHAALSRSLEPMTQAQLAGELGVSRTAISNLMRRALEDGVADGQPGREVGRDNHLRTACRTPVRRRGWSGHCFCSPAFRRG